VRSFINLGEALDHLGRTEEAFEVARLGLEQMRGAWFGLGVLGGDGATRLLKLGRWDEAERFLDEAAIPLTGMAASAVLESRGLLAVLRGEYGPAESLLGEADRLVGNVRGAMWQGPVATARAQAALWQQRPDEALDRMAPALAEAAEDEYVFYVAPQYAIAARAHADVAVKARGLGDGERAAQAATAARELAKQLRARLDVPFVPGEVERHALACELEARRAAAEADSDGWARLAEAWDELGRPYEAAYARWREAEAVLAGPGDRARAESALRSAAEVARRLRAAPLLDEVEGLAQRARLKLGGAAAGSGDASAEPTTADRIGLTPREVDVLRLVAAGRTNKEIADELFMSHKTASVHVSRILSKLDVRGRVEAASLAHRLGLAEPAGDAGGDGDAAA
jgi:DNA-binding CsgD family transcriptional regulator/tetratricopeptide (TPR) repeat protein